MSICSSSRRPKSSSMSWSGLIWKSSSVAGRPVVEPEPGELGVGGSASNSCDSSHSPSSGSNPEIGEEQDKMG